MDEQIDAETIVDGRYRIMHRIGSGGMADVYCAQDLQLGRKVALKLLHRRFAEDEEFVERFRREASSAAGLQHQHVVSVYDRGEWDGTYYIAMEFLEGRSLKQLVQQEAPLDPPRAIDLTVQILRAARFAHKRGIIHRDLKPHNVIVDGEGRLKVTDFGIARAGASDMTQTGSIMGTAQYLSPEQAQGHAVAATSDLYSIGIILYELLTGRIPFDGESAVTIALKQVSEAPTPPSTFNGVVTPALEAVVLKALAKDPADRFAGADEFIDALEHARAGIGAATPATGFAAVAAGTPTDYTTVSPPPPPPPPVLPVAEPAGFYPEDPYEEPPPDEPSRWWIPVLVGLLVVGAIIVALALSGGGTKVTVPGVVGANRAAAEQTLREKGFSTDVTPENSDKPRGEVIGQSPAGGTRAKKGSTVNLVVSDGPQQVTIPPLEGEPRRAVRSQLRKLGLKVEEREEPSDTIGENRVIESIPGQGQRVDKGSTVTLVVSQGPERASVPDVVGGTRDEAQSTLEDAGFKVSVTEKEDPDKDPGTVLSQDPPGGTSAKKGSRVTLTVAKEPTQVDVPDVTGETEDDAIATLSKAGFEIRRTVQDVPTQDGDGVVLEQDPAGGKAKKGARVTITVGRFNPDLAPQDGGTDTTGTTPTP